MTNNEQDILKQIEDLYNSLESSSARYIVMHNIKQKIKELECNSAKNAQ